MKPVTLGIAGATANELGGLLGRSSQAVIEPFSKVLHAVANTLSSHDKGGAIEAGSGENLLENRIDKVLAAAGIKTTEPLELTIDNGKVVVVGDHPQRTLIESAFAQDPTLAKDLSELIQKESNSRLAFPSSASEPESLKVLFLRFAGAPRLEVL